ncbi:MAG: NADH-quinone oxidoreductase subunit K [Candidatus Thiodiazotropha sp.]
MSLTLLYALTGAALFLLGLRATLLRTELLARVVALNVSGAGVFLMLVAIAYREAGQPVDPIPQALVLTGLVVAVSATALALALHRQLRERSDD